MNANDELYSTHLLIILNFKYSTSKQRFKMDIIDIVTPWSIYIQIDTNQIEIHWSLNFVRLVNKQSFRFSGLFSKPKHTKYISSCYRLMRKNLSAFVFHLNHLEKINWQSFKRFIHSGNFHPGNKFAGKKMNAINWSRPRNDWITWKIVAHL